MVDGTGRASLESQRSAAISELWNLLGMDAPHSVAGLDPGTGSVAAELRSLDLLGGLIARYPIALDPDGAGLIRSPSFVAVPRGGIIHDGLFGDILFVAAENGGTLVADAPGFIDRLATFISIPFEAGPGSND